MLTFCMVIFSYIYIYIRKNSALIVLVSYNPIKQTVEWKVRGVFRGSNVQGSELDFSKYRSTPQKFNRYILRYPE